MKLSWKPHSVPIPLRYPLHFVYLKTLNSLKDLCQNNEEALSMAIFHSNQIFFKEHQADMVKKKTEHYTRGDRVKSKFVIFF